jgi:hypothetical protein
MGLTGIGVSTSPMRICGRQTQDLGLGSEILIQSFDQFMRVQAFVAFRRS